MSFQAIQLTEPLAEYFSSVAVRELDILVQLREETQGMEKAIMQITPAQGAFMTQLTCAQRTIEIDVYTGYSSVAVELELPERSKIIACDVNQAWTDAARCYWQTTGVADKIDLRLTPAIETMEALLAEGRAIKRKVPGDTQISVCMLTIGDGLTLARQLG